MLYCALWCHQATMWPHRIRCPQLDFQSEGKLPLISVLGASISSAPGDLLEMSRLIASVCQLPPRYSCRSYPVFLSPQNLNLPSRVSECEHFHKNFGPRSAGAWSVDTPRRNVRCLCVIMNAFSGRISQPLASAVFRQAYWFIEGLFFEGLRAP